MSNNDIFICFLLLAFNIFLLWLSVFFLSIIMKKRYDELHERITNLYAFAYNYTGLSTQDTEKGGA